MQSTGYLLNAAPALWPVLYLIAAAGAPGGRHSALPVLVRRRWTRAATRRINALAAESSPRCCSASAPARRRPDGENRVWRAERRCSSLRPSARCPCAAAFEGHLLRRLSAGRTEASLNGPFPEPLEPVPAERAGKRAPHRSPPTGRRPGRHRELLRRFPAQCPGGGRICSPELDQGEPPGDAGGRRPAVRLRRSVLVVDVNHKSDTRSAACATRVTTCANSSTERQRAWSIPRWNSMPCVTHVPRAQAKAFDLVRGSGRAHERHPRPDAIVLVDVNIIAETDLVFVWAGVLVNVTHPHFSDVPQAQNIPMRRYFPQPFDAGVLHVRIGLEVGGHIINPSLLPGGSHRRRAF